MPRNRMELSPERVDTFISVYIHSWGNFSEAARAASPHSSASAPCRTSFLQLKERDPGFRARLADADRQLKDMVLEEMRRRALVGDAEPQFQKAQRIWDVVTDEDGEPVRDENGELKKKPAVQMRKSEKAFFALARKIDPDSWSEKTTVEHQGTVEHKMIPTSAEMLNYSPEELEVIDRFLELRGAKPATAEALEHQPGEVIDATYEEVEEKDAIELYEEQQSNG